MKKQLDAWGAAALVLLGTALLGCGAEAHARPVEYPVATGQPGLSATPEIVGTSEDAVENVAVEPPASDFAHLADDHLAADDAPMLVDDYDPDADRDPSALSEFHEVLAPHGQWTEDAVYGTVWIPDAAAVGPDFAPYVTAGHWALTEDDEWLWVSDYEWGWVPFHYGRWVWIAGRGWAWIPGRVYAPAWVVWRTGYYDDHYIGWAPMPPTWYWRSGVAVSLVVVPPAPYVFCSTHYIFTPHIHTHIVPAHRVSVVARHTRPYYPASPRGRSYASYARGPSPREARVPARAAPRASHHPRAIAAARPGGRITTTAKPRLAPNVAPQPSRAGAVQRRTPAGTYSRTPSAIAPRPSPPSRTVPQVRPQAPAVPRAPRTPTSPRPAPVTPRIQPTPRASVQKIRPAPSKPSVAPRATIRPTAPRTLPAPTTRKAR